MGGIGSGRRHQGGKNTTSDMRALDIRRLQRDGLLTSGRAFNWQWTINGAKHPHRNRPRDCQLPEPKERR